MVYDLQSQRSADSHSSDLYSVSCKMYALHRILHFSFSADSLLITLVPLRGRVPRPRSSCWPWAQSRVAFAYMICGRANGRCTWEPATANASSVYDKIPSMHSASPLFPISRAKL